MMTLGIKLDNKGVFCLSAHSARGSQINMRCVFVFFSYRIIDLAPRQRTFPHHVYKWTRGITCARIVAARLSGAAGKAQKFLTKN